MPIHIRDFLDKFLKLKNRRILLKNFFIEVVYDNTNIILKEKQIEFDEKTIIIETIPIIKNELFMKQEKILREFNKKINQKFITIR